MWDEKTIQALIARLREKLITWTFLEKRVILSLSKNSGEITPSGKLVQINSVVLIC